MVNTMNDEMIVEVRNLTKKFGPANAKSVAVDNISFSIKEGEIVGFLGPNGAGKTTTIQMLLGLVIPTSGTIDIFHKSLFQHREEILSEMNFSSTYTHLPWRLSVFENLYVVALLYSVKNARDKVAEVIKKMNLEEIKDETIDKLSSGWITRVNLARTFLNNPRLILLDEPTASLDPEGADEIRKKILEYRKREKATILWTSHNMAEVEEVCDRVIFLHKGKIIAEDTPRGLAKTIKFCRVSFIIEEKQDEFLRIIAQNKWKAIVSDKFITIELVEEDIPLLIQILAEEEISYSEISIDKPTLEDFFISTARKK
ncbi:ABC transporter ATP-binding protein [Candidatus Microgenomates bacterium]|nr:ABC transporter ATP-binding protein [Candidatus Microgenomates bacterium]